MSIRGGAVSRLRAVPKPGGGIRWLVTLSAADGLAYRLAVARLVPAIERVLGPGVVANRVVGRGSRAWTVLEPWRPAREAFRLTLARLGASYEGVTMTDVRDCFGSIGPVAVERSLRGLPRDDVVRVLRLLDRFEAEGVRGLPIGPNPSAILANVVLSAVDRSIGSAGASHLRWVDDVAIAARNEAGLRRALQAACEALEALGLEPNGAKTRWLPAEQLRSSASAVGLSRSRDQSLQ